MRLKQFLVTCLLMFAGMGGVFAYDFEVDGIYYNITNSSTKTVEVTYPNATKPINETPSGYNDKDITEMQIPSVVTNTDGMEYTVTKVGNYAFNYCKKLTSVTIGNNVETIGEYAFRGCSNLGSATIGNNVETIDSEAFYKCEKLATINIPNSVTKIGSYAFEYCKSLTNVVIPGSVTSLGRYSFANCEKLKSVEIHGGKVSNHAFYGCSVLTDVTIHDGVTSIEQSAFNECVKLESIEIPNCVEYIDRYAFQDCIALKKVTIGSGVTNINSQAFNNCTALTEIVCHATTPPTCTGNPNPFTNVPTTTCTLYVPKDCQEYYEVADVWKDFTKISEDENDEDVNITLGETGYATYCSKYNLDFRGMEGVKAYVASSYNESEGAIVIEEAEVVPVGTGIILIGEEGMHDVPITDNSNVINHNLLAGTNNAKQLSKSEGNYTNYVLGRKDTEVGFFQPKDNETITAHKAYLQLPTSQAQGISYLRIGGSDNTTGIEQVTPQAAPKSDAIYNLNGQRVETPQRGGIYIVNGKKKLF